jgi:His-Xaa-Ser system protein HxsD
MMTMNEQIRISYSIKDGKASILLYRLFFQREAVLAAAQKMTDQFFIEIKSMDSEKAEITLEPKGGTSIEKRMNESELEGAAKILCNEVLDQQVRLDLEQRYGRIREMIVRQAFAPITLDELSKELNS